MESADHKLLNHLFVTVIQVLQESCCLHTVYLSNMLGGIGQSSGQQSCAMLSGGQWSSGLWLTGSSQ